MAHQISSQDWSDFLIRIGAISGPAELHGMLCGSLCAGKSLDSAQWVARAYEFLDLLEDTNDAEVHGALEALFEMVRATLKDQSYSMQLLLPEDAVPLPDRTGALARWCQGYLFGFGSTENMGEALDYDAKEALLDLAQIAQLEQSETAEDDEELYVELVEYVRLAVFDIFAQLNIDVADSLSGTDDLGDGDPAEEFDTEGDAESDSSDTMH